MSDLLNKSCRKQLYDKSSFIEGCTDSCFDTGCCYSTRAQKLQIVEDDGKRLSAIEGCTDSCFDTGCCYSTRAQKLQIVEDDGEKLSAIEGCTDSCFDTGCCYSTRASQKAHFIDANRANNKKMTVQFEVTHECNHKCFYCYNPNRACNNLNDYNYLREMASITASLVITGGEPFLYYERTLSIVNYAMNFGIDRISINSNASLLNANKIVELHNLYPNLSFLISFPSADRNNYRLITGCDDFDKVLENISLLVKVFGAERVVANMVINQINKNDICKTANTLFDVGLRIFKHSIMSPFKKGISYALSDIDIDYVFKELSCAQKRRPWIMFGSTHAFPLCRIPNEMLNSNIPFVKCGMGQAVSCLSVDGKLYPCPSMLDSKYGISLSDYAKGKSHLLSHNDILENISNPCKDCALLKYCGAGCVRENNANMNDIFSAPRFAKRLSPKEIIIKKIRLGIPVENLTDIFSFEKKDNYYSRVCFCGEWQDENVLLFSNKLVRTLESKKLTNAEQNIFLRTVYRSFIEKVA